MSLSASSSGPVFSGRTYFQAPALVFALIGPGVFFFRKPNDAPDNAAIPLRRSIRQLKLTCALCLFVSQAVLTIFSSGVNPSDGYYFAVMCMPSAAVGILAFDIFRGYQPPIVLDAYLVLVLFADLARTWDYWMQPGLSLVSAVSGAAALANTVCLFWVPVCHFCRAALELPASLKTRYDSGRMLTETMKTFLCFGFVEFRSKADLPDFGPAYTAQSLSNKFDTAWARANKRSRHALLKTLFRILKWPLLAMIPPRLCRVCSQLYGVLLLRRIVAFTEMDISSKDDSGWHIILGMVVSCIAASISGLWSQHMEDRFDGLFHGILSSTSWKKVLSISPANASQFEATGAVRAQIQRVTANLCEFHAIWLAPVEICLALYFFFSVEGSICFFMFPSLIAATIITTYIGWRSTNAITRSRNNSSRLVLQTSHIVSDAKGIKMLGLEEQVMWYLEPLQEADVASNRDIYFYQLLSMASLIFVTDLPPLSVIAAGIYWTGAIEMNATTIFSILAFTALFLDPSIALMRDAPRLENRTSALTEIQQFLLLEEIQDQRTIAEDLLIDGAQRHLSPIQEPPTAQTLPAATVNEPNVLEFRDVSITLENTKGPLLAGVDFSVRRGQRLAVTGPVGSGKTTILKAMTGELPVSQGSIWVRRSDSTIAYCGQQLWLDDASIRNNITKGVAYNHERYKRVVWACMLDKDIEELPGLDAFRIGINGSNLSGGQQQRVALARTLYCEPGIAIIDDILSGLDKQTVSRIFSRVIGPNGLLARRGITTIFVTNSIDLISQSDRAIHVDKHHNVFFARDDAEIKQLVDEKVVAGDAEPEENDPIGENPFFFSDMLDDSTIQQIKSVAVPGRGKRDTSLTFYLVKSVAATTVIICIAFTSTYAIMERTGTGFVKGWVELAPTNLNMFWGYVAIVCLRVVFTWVESQLYHMMVIPQCVLELHQDLLKTILSAPFAVLDAVDSEILFYRILSDIATVSRVGAKILRGTVYGFAMISTDVILIIHGVPALLFVFPVLFAAMYCIGGFYFQAMQALRQMADEAKSDIEINTKEVGHGLEHIRAMGWQQRYLDKGFELLDNAQRIANAGFQLRSWLATYIYLVVSIMLVAAAIVVVLLREHASPAGVGITFLLGLWSSSELKSFFRQFSRFEESVVATANVRTFITEAPLETDDAAIDPPANWPQKGEVVMKAVNATYKSAEVAFTALHDITLHIRPGQKVGIIGRTGSGKSTFLLTLLNLLDYEGSIKIDNIEISQVHKKLLRSRITTIPQHPTKLPGTIRDNLLPWDLTKFDKSVPDADILLLLSELGIREYIEELGGLDAKAEDVEMSKGEKQLLAIARAILHHRVHDTHIVLMDEVTSSLNPEVGTQILWVLNRAFRGCTTFIVAHKTETLEHVQLVLEFAKGRLAVQVER